VRADYFKKVFCEARKETWDWVFADRPFTVIIATGVACFAIYLQRRFGGQSSPQMIDALVSIAYGLIAYAVVFILIFGAHFFYLTPKRMLEEGEGKLRLAEDRIAALQQARQPRIKVSCGREIDGCVVPDHQGIWYRARLDLAGPECIGA
jgi:hypothetical protein